MNNWIKLSSVLVCLGVVAFAEPAYTQTTVTECQQISRLDAYKLVSSVSNRQASVNAVYPTIMSAAQSCPDDKVMQHYAAQMSYWQALQLNATKASASDIRKTWADAMKYSDRYWDMHARDQYKSGVKYERVTDLRKNLIMGLFELSKGNNPDMAYLLNPPNIHACTKKTFWDVSAAQSRATQVPSDAKQAIEFADNVISVCSLEKGGELLAFKSLNSMKLHQAGKFADSDPEFAQSLVGDIEAYRDELAQGDLNETRYYWSLSDARRLTDVKSKLPITVSIPTAQDDPLTSATSIAVSQWFDPETPDLLAHSAMGETLNVYLAQEGVAAGFARALGKMYKEMEAAEDPKFARKRLYDAVHFYANGNYRTLETKDTNISNSLYAWLEPKN